jgi:hypothetical protein
LSTVAGILNEDAMKLVPQKLRYMPNTFIEVSNSELGDVAPFEMWWSNKTSVYNSSE